MIRKRSKLHYIFGILFTILLIWAMVTPVSAVPAIYEYYNTNDDDSVEIYAGNWSAQTFTIDPASHSVSSILLKLYREGAPGDVILSIKETDSGLPVGAALTNSIIDGDILTTSTSGVWYAFEIDPALSLDYGEVYAIVLKNPEGVDTSTNVHWMVDGSTATYTGGSECISTNSGTSWSADTDDDYMFEVYGDPLLSINSVQVFNGYWEDDDMLIVMEYENYYTPYYPRSDPEQYFDLQLRSTDGATVLATVACPAWGNRPGSIYRSADAAASLTPGTAYRVYIYGSGVTETPSDYYTLTSADWRGDNLDALDTWVITTAHNIEEHDEIELVTEVTGSGEILNEQGGIIFSKGIPGLSYIRGHLFQIVVYNPEYESGEWTNVYDTATDWETQLGTDVVAAFTDLGDIFGLSGRATGGFLLAMVYVGIAVFAGSRTHNITITAGLALPFVALMTWLRIIDVAVMMVIGGVIILIMVFSTWWSRT